jgi:hypothetical protein
MHVLRLLPRAALATAVLVIPGAAQAQEASEFQIKGAYLFKFGDYVEWPAGSMPPPGAPFVIGILGDDPFGDALDQTVQGRSVHDHPVVIRRLQRVEQARGVQILYLSQSEAERWDQDMAALRGQNVLTICDKDHVRGSVIAFLLQGNKVRFEIDSGAAERAGLKLSSKLLSLATSVRRTE